LDSEKSGPESTILPALIRTISLWTRHCARDCNKKVNHEMPAERFSSSLSPIYRAHFVSAAKLTRVRDKNRRKMAAKSMPLKERKQPRYQ